MIATQRRTKRDWRRSYEPFVAQRNQRISSVRNHGLWFWTGAPCSPQRTWAENDVFPMPSLHVRRLLFAPNSLCPSQQFLKKTSHEDIFTQDVSPIPAMHAQATGN